MNDPRLPKFIVIGVMKCGTGATQHFLHNHPDLAQAKARFQYYLGWNNRLCSIERL